MKRSPQSEWEPCASGELGRMVGRIKARGRARLLRRIAMGSVAVALIAVSAFSSTLILPKNAIEPANQAYGSGDLARSAGCKVRSVETVGSGAVLADGVAGPDAAVAAEGSDSAGGNSADEKGAAADEEAIAVIKEKVEETPAKTEVAAPKPHMNCNRAQNLLLKFIRKELDDDLALAVKDHLLRCKWCHKWYTALGGPPLTAQFSDSLGAPMAAAGDEVKWREVEWLELASTPWMRNR